MNLITVTAEYDSMDAIRNTKEDLVGTGIEQERIFIDEDKLLVKVAISSTMEPEITEILNRHNPATVYETKR